jgi:thiamine-monophosphate kinase
MPESRDDEFGLIAAFLAPLAGSRPEACGLRDDAAWLRSRPGHDLVLTTDAIVAGVHFLADDPPDLVARKAIGVNLSDLAAKGAAPDGYLLTLALPVIDREWLRRFVAGLRADQDAFGITLVGGDTVSTPGPLTASVTAFGWVEAGRMIRRSGARVGDRVYVSGTLGDAALGLMLLQNPTTRKDAGEGNSSYLIGRYRRPRPRVDLGLALVGRANACADISDGLVADLGHICATSNVSAEIRADRLPLSTAALGLPRAGFDATGAALSGGDDYELVFTAPAECAESLKRLASELALNLTDIGEIVAGDGAVFVRDAAGEEVPVPRSGWNHFAKSGGSATQA